MEREMESFLRMLRLGRRQLRLVGARAKRQIRTTLMFAVSSSRHKNALLARKRFRMAAAEQGRRHDHQNDG
jgi:hypothetical protein